MCGMVLHLGCLDFPSELVAIDPNLMWLLRLSILHRIGSVFFVGTSGQAIIEFHQHFWFMI